MLKLTLAFSLLAACGGSKQPETTTATPPASEPTQPTGPAAMTPEECVAQGGAVKGDIGDGKVACDPGQRDLGRVNQGIEGAVCCAPPTLAP